MTKQLYFSKLQMRIATYTLFVPIIILLSFIIAACATNTPIMSNIYIAEVHGSSRNGGLRNGTSYRIGYFGICGRIDASGAQRCAPISFFPKHMDWSAIQPGDIRDGTRELLQGSDQWEVIVAMAYVVHSTIFSALPAAALAALLLALIPIGFAEWHLRRGVLEKSLARRVRWHIRCLRVLLWTSTALALASAVGTTQVTASWEYLTEKVVSAGLLLRLLQWALVVLLLAFAIGVPAVLMVELREIGERKPLLKSMSIRSMSSTYSESRVVPRRYHSVASYAAALSPHPSLEPASPPPPVPVKFKKPGNGEKVARANLPYPTRSESSLPPPSSQFSKPRTAATAGKQTLPYPTHAESSSPPPSSWPWRPTAAKVARPPPPYPTHPGSSSPPRSSRSLRFSFVPQRGAPAIHGSLTPSGPARPGFGGVI